MPAPRGSSALHSVPFRKFARTEGKAASADPGAEFMRHGKSSSSESAGNSTATRSRSKLPPMKETMQLLFSPDKRQVDQERARFREVIHTMQAAPVENVMGLISSNVPFFLGTNTSLFMQEMLEELDSMDPATPVPLGGGYQVTVEQQRTALVNLFTLTMDFIEGFVSHTQGELRSHQAVLKEIMEAAQKKSSTELDATLKRLRPQFREDFVTYLRGEYERVSTPPMTEDSVVLANLLQAIQARVLAEVEDMMGSDVSQVSRLLAFSDEEQVVTALRGSFLAGSLQPDQFLEMVETVLADLDERMPALLDSGNKDEELREMHRKLSAIRAFTVDYVAEMK
ncbi:hypothetical protein NSK_003804 [Nannochloropsis salina CCMP1776]|uniref:Uncharacterized protein n=1 Tax=Nannochloropsis salina CCMP1776 TaxID=1027361 RepID=A0A4D9CZE8_9STRA|nr:hypothetical protein NSK_003804 [Nannochloropsis salina CCMP1776]|eukprot:TFJ84772.1 hypothetical protein NSK_003804 [Nannochloropsis salina CCMP1776]